MARKTPGQPTRSAGTSRESDPKSKAANLTNAGVPNDKLQERTIWSAAETQAHEASVEAWLVQGATFGSIASSLMAQVQGMSKFRAMKLVRRVFERWRQEDMERREHARSEQIRRVFSHLNKALKPKFRSRMVGDVGTTNRREVQEELPLNHMAIARYENLLADLQGTREPIKIDVDVRVSQALVPVLIGLTGDQVRHLLERGKERLRLARLAVVELKLEPDADYDLVKVPKVRPGEKEPVIDTKGEEVKS